MTLNLELSGSLPELLETILKLNKGINHSHFLFHLLFDQEILEKWKIQPEEV